MPVGITNFVLTPAKTTLLFRNNQPNTIRIDEISIDEKVCRSDDLTNPSSKKWTLSVGESRKISCINVYGNNSERYNYPLSISYTDKSNGASYTLNDEDSRLVGKTSTITCPDGYISVPGSETYGTSDFCVMKWEAKNVGGNATSQAAETPWVSISQTEAIANCSALGEGYHLITNEEWMTIARNVEQVEDNWNSSVVGIGGLYRGNNGDFGDLGCGPFSILDGETTGSNCD
ncbi:MAG: hypothetical protein R6U19_06900, partial [Bacteroidales bacterium]